MEIIFYKNSAEPERVDKTPFIKFSEQISGELRSSINISKPSVIINKDALFDCNYAYIPLFNRYYFIDSIVSMGEDLWLLDMACDVLMTYKEDIYLNYAVIGRQEYDYNPYLEDDSVPTESGYDLDIIEWDSTNDSDTNHKFYDKQDFDYYDTVQYILTTIGPVHT